MRQERLNQPVEPEINCLGQCSEATRISASSAGEAIGSAACACLAGHKIVAICPNSSLGNMGNPLTNPSLGIDWENRERMSPAERDPADVILALALVHHLAISNNLPLNMVASFFSQLCRWLIIGFVPKTDSQIQWILPTREDIFPDYTQEAFETECGKLFTIMDTVPIQDSQRTLYLMQRHEL
jgi:hypothetical protein